MGNWEYYTFTPLNYMQCLLTFSESILVLGCFDILQVSLVTNLINIDVIEFFGFFLLNFMVVQADVNALDLG